MSILRCESCNAVLDFTDGKDFVRCPYCDAYNRSTLSVNEADGINLIMKSLYNRALEFLDGRYWDKANEYFGKVLDMDPEYAPAYIGKVCVKRKVRKEEDLVYSGKSIEKDFDFKLAIRYATEEQKIVYNGYVAKIIERLAIQEEERKKREEQRKIDEAERLRKAEEDYRKYEEEKARQRKENMTKTFVVLSILAAVITIFYTITSITP